ncbi:hypothetical protein QBC45DRAFT_136818 [Copromyces sp. CBS 386.78]|nr:hypothetical protein QBC45DRAFT_136818 [Copromyces sp. CBS 386.78]
MLKPLLLKPPFLLRIWAARIPSSATLIAQICINRGLILVSREHLYLCTGGPATRSDPLLGPATIFEWSRAAVWSVHEIPLLQRNLACRNRLH